MALLGWKPALTRPVVGHSGRAASPAACPHADGHWVSSHSSPKVLVSSTAVRSFSYSMENEGYGGRSRRLKHVWALRTEEAHGTQNVWGERRLSCACVCVCVCMCARTSWFLVYFHTPFGENFENILTWKLRIENKNSELNFSWGNEYLKSDFLYIFTTTYPFDKHITLCLVVSELITKTSLVFCFSFDITLFFFFTDMHICSCREIYFQNWHLHGCFRKSMASWFFILWGRTGPERVWRPGHAVDSLEIPWQDFPVSQGTTGMPVNSVYNLFSPKSQCSKWPFTKLHEVFFFFRNTPCPFCPDREKLCFPVICTWITIKKLMVFK